MHPEQERACGRERDEAGTADGSGLMPARRVVGDTEGRAALVAVRDARARGGQADRATLRPAVKYTLALLEARAPGHSVEVRVPPLAAVQAVPGPVHRRGTPSAVVELDPDTWLALATGSLAWDDARAGGRIRASGVRADLSAWLPLVGPGEVDPSD